MSQHIKTTAKFTLLYPNKEETFTSQLNKVTGKFILDFKKEVSLNEVGQIQIGLKGDIRTRAYYPSKRRVDSQVIVLFNQFAYTESNDANITSRLWEFPIDCKFPCDRIRLPSSVHLKTDSVPKREIAIRYELYVRINEKDVYRDFLVPLNFQDGSVSVDKVSNSKLDYSNLSFPNRMKSYVRDSISNSMIPNERNNFLLKRIKGLKRDSTSRNINLRLTADLSKPLNLANPISDLPIKLETLTPFTTGDLMVKGKSTELGSFQIKYIKIQVKQYMKILGEELITKEKEFSFCQNKNMLEFDIKDFSDEVDSQSKYWNTTLGELGFEDDKRPFLELLSEFPNKLITTNKIPNGILTVDHTTVSLDIAIQTQSKRGLNSSSLNSDSYEVASLVNKDMKFNLAFDELLLDRLECNRYPYEFETFQYQRVFRLTKGTAGSGGGIGTLREVALGPDGYKGDIYTYLWSDLVAKPTHCWDISDSDWDPDYDNSSIQREDSGSNNADYPYYIDGCYDCGFGYYSTDTPPSKTSNHSKSYSAADRISIHISNSLKNSRNSSYASKASRSSRNSTLSSMNGSGSSKHSSYSSICFSTDRSSEFPSDQSTFSSSRDVGSTGWG